MSENTPVTYRLRNEGLHVERVDGEALVYDLHRDLVHCLAPDAASVFAACAARSDVRTLAVAIGPARAHFAAWGALLLATGLAAILAPWLTDHPQRVWLAALLATLLVGINAVIWHRNARSGALAAFPCIATGAALLGVGWAAALVAL